MAIEVRRTTRRDIRAIVALSQRIYGARHAWRAPHLLLHQAIFPEGQLVAVDSRSGRVLAMAVSLVIRKERWPPGARWARVTARGTLATHEPAGDVLYAAGVAVDPGSRGRGVGSALYRAREALLEERGLDRIRAGARVPGYREAAHLLSAEEYVNQVVRGDRTDPTLSFQLARDFEVVEVAAGYLPEDRASLGYAAIVEWRPPGARERPA